MARSMVTVRVQAHAVRPGDRLIEDDGSPLVFMTEDRGGLITLKHANGVGLTRLPRWAMITVRKIVPRTENFDAPRVVHSVGS